MKSRRQRNAIARDKPNAEDIDDPASTSRGGNSRRSAKGKTIAPSTLHTAITRMPVLQEAAGKQTRSPFSVGTSMQRTISRRNADRIGRKSRRTEPQGRYKALRATPITLVTVKPDTISKVDASESEITRKEIYAEIDERPVRFHVDCRATVNVIPKEFTRSRDIAPTDKVLQMRNKAVGARRHVPHDVAESDHTQETLAGIDGCPRSPDTPTWSKSWAVHPTNQSKGTRCCSLQPSTQSVQRCFYCRLSWNVQGSSTSKSLPRRTNPEHSPPEQCLLP